jgi:hypothetical protein
MTLDIEDAPSREEIRLALEDARASLGVWRFRTLCAAAAWLFCCAAIYPFLAGHFLHAYWESIKFLVFLPTMIAPLTLTICAITWWGAWSDVRSLKRLSSVP